MGILRTISPLPAIFLLTGALTACQSGSDTGADATGNGKPGDAGEEDSSGKGDGETITGDGDALGDGDGSGDGDSMGDGDISGDGDIGGNIDLPPVVQPPAVRGADFYSPAPMHELLAQERMVAWTSLDKAPADLVRFSWSASGSDDFFLANDDGQAVIPTLTRALGLGEKLSAKDDILLRSMFQFVEQEPGVFRIVSSKHPNFALDSDGSGGVILRDVRSMEREDASAGFLGFQVSGNGPFTLEAASRWVPQSGAVFVQQQGFSAQNLTSSGGQLRLSDETGTEFALHNPPINFDIPFDFNPEEIARTDNAEVTPFSKGEDKQSTFANKVTAEYQAQVSAPGPDARTGDAAALALEAIEATLASKLTTLRYPPDFYLAMRDGFLRRIYLSHEATDGTLGQYTVPYVYFTNGIANDGEPHPFMVIVTRGLPDSMALLWDVPHPPGDGLAVGYENQENTRSYHRENFVIKIPMRDYGQVSSLTENHMVSDLASGQGEAPSHHSYASISAIGVAIDGVVIYPTFNNGLHISAGAGELSAHGHHAGQGLGTHYHADSHSAEGRGLNLYNASDYVGRYHPPIISVGFDGVAGFGIYPLGDTTLDGADVSLDQFGGHEHDDYGYHYHSHAVPAVSEKKGVNYTAHQLPPLGAWAGRINDVPAFWNGVHPDYSGKGSTRYLGTGTAEQ